MKSTLFPVSLPVEKQHSDDYVRKANLYFIFKDIFEEFPEDAIAIIQFIASACGNEYERMFTKCNSLMQANGYARTKDELLEQLWVELDLPESAMDQTFLQQFQQDYILLKISMGLH